MLPLGIESWIWWSFVILVAILRFISRRLTLGTFRKYQLDDVLMVLVLCIYTVLIVAINIVVKTNSNLLPPGFDVNTLTPADIAEREYGSKLVLVVEQCQCATVWGAKACLITMYLHLTLLRKENIAIKCLAVYVGVTYVVMEVLYFAVWCRPFHEYWAVPTNSSQCDAATNHLITNAVFNLSSDCIMLLICLPMFLRLQLPWQKKVPLVLVFSLGIFVILAAVLNKVFSFTNPFGLAWSSWYVRESSTALLVANLPFCWPIIRRVVGLEPPTGRSQDMLTTFAQSRTGQPEYRHQGDRPDWNDVRSPFEKASHATTKITAESSERGSMQSSEDHIYTLEQILGQSVSLSTESLADPFTHPLKYQQLAGARAQTTSHGHDIEAEASLASARQNSLPVSQLDTISAASAVSSSKTKKTAGSFL